MRAAGVAGCRSCGLPESRAAQAAGSACQRAGRAFPERRRVLTGTRRVKGACGGLRQTLDEAAVRRAHERPAVADAPSVRAELAALLAAADHNPALWAGAAGVTDRAVLAALVDVALAAATLTPSASTRQLGERANISHSTAAVALGRLVTRGWLRQEQPANGTLAATWRLVRPANLPALPREVDELLEALLPRPLTPAGGSARAHDAFAHTIHGGLGRVAARVFDALDDGAHGGLSVRQLAALTGLHPRTIIRHLVALQAADLATSGGGGRTWSRSLAAGDATQLPAILDAAATMLGCAGTTERRAAQHAAQREAYVAYWADFTARRGWAVQRGLYRPDQPRLPLPLAA